MGDLIDRIAGTNRDVRHKINLHRWIGVQRLYALNEWTRAQIAADFDLIGFVDEERQATQIATVIDSFTGGNASLNKIIYIGRIEGVMMCMEDSNDRLYHNTDGTLNRPKILEDLQIVG